MQNIINYNLDKRNSIAPNLYEGSNSKEVLINLKYPRQKGKQLLSKMEKIVSNSLENDIKPKVVYSSAKLNQYFNIKYPVPQKYKIDLAYKCACPQIVCNASYIGQTGRCFEERIINHNKRD